MAEPITLADIYALFQASQAEADRRFAEADRRAAEANRLATERAAEADRRMKELEKVAANTSREVAGLTTRWGQFVENLVEPGVVRLFQERGIQVKETARRMTSNRLEAPMEIDIWAVDGDVAVAIEVKSRLSGGDVDGFLDTLSRFRLAFPHYGDYRIYGAVAAIEIDRGVDRYAYQRGLWVIKQTGDTVTLANDLSFQPRSW
jgi:RecB family endonuclease NucS